MAEIDGGHLFAKALKHEGVEYVFTLNGGHIYNLYEGCVDEGIKVIDFRHEQVAGHAAEGWAKVTRKPGVAIVTAGPGVTDAVTALANALAPEAGPVLLRLAKDSKKPLALRTIAVNGLAKAKTGAKALLTEAKAGRLPTDLNFAAGNALRGVRWKNLRAQAAKLFPPPQGLGQALPPLAKLVAMKGDIANGEKIFFRPQSTCATCHQVNGRGIDFGPKLSGIGTKLGREALFLSILDPSAGISVGYEAWLLKTKNSAEAIGIITSQTDDEVTLKVPGGISITYKAADIVRRTQLPTSIMLPGLQATMTPQELVDLIAYLHSLKQAKQ